MTVHTFDGRDHQVDLADVIRALTGIAMIAAFGGMFLLVLGQVAAVIS